jgi:ABC-type bacteriocin/lantibiotic exporter with double-glycine peptidase domain
MPGTSFEPAYTVGPLLVCWVAAIVLTAAIHLAWVWFRRAGLQGKVTSSTRRLAEAGVFDLAAAPDFFTRLVQTNFQFIEAYYRQTQIQADRSFWVTCGVAIAGFILVAFGVWKVFQGNTEITAGGVATIAGVLSEFIAAVFFYFFNRTVQSMAQYLQKLVITQNVSLALKTAETLTPEAESTAARKLIVDRLTQDINLYLTSSIEARARPTAPRSDHDGGCSLGRSHL